MKCCFKNVVGNAVMYVLVMSQIFSMVAIKKILISQQLINCYASKVQPARNLHKPSDPGGQNYPPSDPGGHDPRVSR